MGVRSFLESNGSGIRIPLSEIERFRLIFPAEKIVHLSRGIDRTERMPTRYYETPTGQWATDDPNLIRLLHNDFPFMIDRIAKVPNGVEFIATSTNYGSNPYFCIRHATNEKNAVRLFHLEQENIHEPHLGLSVVSNSFGLQVEAVQVVFDTCNQSATDINGQKLSDEALIFTAPAIVWNGKFVGWEDYAKATYDCRHIVNLQYAKGDECSTEFERTRAEIQRLQRFWKNRDEYVHEVLGLAKVVGFAEYERLIIGVGGESGNRFLLMSSIKGTAKDVAVKLKSRYPNINAAFQISEGGGTGILLGTTSNEMVVGPSSYRRGRVLCCLLIESKGRLCMN